MTGRPGVGPIPARVLLPLFVSTTFVGAFLLFWIQPLFTKRVLPLLGGSPGVWNTALVFFQGTLLLGYLYVHLTTRKLSPRGQILSHLALLAAVFLALPIDVAQGWAPPGTGVPTPWLLALLTVSIGLPFFAVSTTAPLVQRWFARTGHPHAGDPYFLYSASNLGSLAALVAFPVALEPLVGVERQGWLWALGYGGLALLLGACGVVAWRGAGAAGRVRVTAGGEPAGASEPAGEPAEPGEPAAAGVARSAGWRLRLRWLLLAAVPSSLLLGVTAHISTDLASFPLLWIVPLVLYLLTYIVAFARRPVIRHEWMLKAQPYLLILLALSLTWEAAQRLLLFNVGLHLTAFFVIAMVCHRELAERRPPAAHLTEFYLWLSLGGVLGGAFTALVAPALFETVLEYPLAVVLAAMLRPASRGSERSVEAGDVLWPAALLVPVLLLVALVGARDFWTDVGMAGPLLVFGFGALVVFHFTGRPIRFGSGLAVLLLTGSLLFEPEAVIARERSFFGIHKVTVDEAGPYHLLFHGTTLHGAQHTAPGKRRTPLLYYAPEGPAGQLFERLDEERPDEMRRPGAVDRASRRVGVVGLGSGALACYGRARDRWTFFDIDPTVVRIARDTTLFRYLEGCRPDVRIVLGDGRLSLEAAPDGSFDLLVLDAFSSDAIPVHLLTVEAARTYASKLSADGLLLFHISNRYLDLEPVLANVASAAGLAGRVQRFSVEPGSRAKYRASSTWVAIAREAGDLALLDGDERWKPLVPDPDVGTWTDDFSNILEVLDIWGS